MQRKKRKEIDAQRNWKIELLDISFKITMLNILNNLKYKI